MTTLPNLDDLMRLAREAQGAIKEPSWYEDCDPCISVYLRADRAFIAAASPAVVMGILERLERAEEALRQIKAHCRDEAFITAGMIRYHIAKALPGATKRGDE